MNKFRDIVLAAIFVGSSCFVALATEIHVSPAGRDINTGTAEQPVQSLHAAQRLARRIAGKESVRVILHGGTYYLSEPLVFTAADSGAADASVTYMTAAGEQVTVSGGRRLSLQWKPHANGIYTAATPDGLSTDQLFVNGERQHMARYPNYDPNAAIYNGCAADAFSPQRAARWHDPAGGFIHAMHRARWGGYSYRITGRNAAGEITYEGGWQNNRQMGMHPEHRFVENIFEELDAPGEWFHDTKTNTLYYYPPAEVDPASATVEVVHLRHLVEFRGTQQSPVRFVNLHGLIFRHAARTCMDTREPLLRSDWTIYRGGAVLYTGAEDCQLVDCTFDQVGGNAVFVSNYNRRIVVRGCLISDGGASGICFVGDPDAVRNPLFESGQRHSYDQIDKAPGPKTENYPADCVVDDCLIRRIGRVEKQTAGVQISMARRITVSHCSIYECPRAGINIGDGCWGGHVIEFCDVFDTVLETGDHGSFNSWGRDRFWGLMNAPAQQLADLAKLDAVEPTIIRNSRWRCDHGWDIDLDDGSSNYHIYNNLLLHGGLKFREGYHRIGENNIIADNSFHPHVWYSNSEDVFRRNIVFTNYRPIRVGKPWGRLVDYNLLHKPDAAETEPATSLQAQSGRDEHSIVADAMLVDSAHGDYRIRSESPARSLGFINFSMDQFGVRSPRLRAMARAPVTAATHVATDKSTPVVTWLGATATSLTTIEQASAAGVALQTGGAMLVEVPAGSPAAKADLRTGDLITGLADHRINNVDDLLLAMKGMKNGSIVPIQIVRDQSKQTLKISISADR